MALRHTRTRAGIVSGIALTALALTGCATDTETPSAGTGDDRCSLNEAAGTITYLSGYQWQASASILEVVAAKELGYFDELCLDVALEPGSGETSQNAQLLAAGTVQVTPLSLQNLIQSQDTGIDVLGVSSYSNVGLEILMTMADVTDLTELDGTTLGHKGSVPPTVLAMLEDAGVDVDSLTQVQVGYDPSVLPRGQVDSLTGFISNEPNLLAASGEDVTVWRPYDYGVASSLGALAVNRDFASAHPTAVEDFLRATLHAYEYCAENAAECVAFTAELSGEGYDASHNQKIWETEVGIVAESLNEDALLGAIDVDNFQAIATMLSGYALLETTPSSTALESYIDTSFIEALYSDGTLVWPGN